MRLMVLAAAAALTLASPARATDFSVMLNDIDGAALFDDVKCPPSQTGARTCQDKLTLGAAVAHALLAVLPNDDNDAIAKLDRWRLAGRVAHGGLLQLSAPDTAMVIKRLSIMYGPAVVGPAISLLDPHFGEK